MNYRYSLQYILIAVALVTSTNPYRKRFVCFVAAYGGEPLRGEPSPRSNENVYKQPNRKRFPRKKSIALCSTVTKDQLRSAETPKPSAKIFIAPENLTKALEKLLCVVRKPTPRGNEL